ncbi:uncharacterized protein J8A68_002308 [[Candida] subhashii]|uniref:FYVE-type domain-containing protein n=1 Tax=[Candida] subhashii TaxID=561895 RepID=A0A8J5QPH5_9ASCO|nr:uncharacterized protein J8A68_002308 [[Candida] subhashii]KAG7664170.1 hypothetical protein J8A68_002308 [[Candida] subhashii]
MSNINNPRTDVSCMPPQQQEYHNPQIGHSSGIMADTATKSIHHSPFQATITSSLMHNADEKNTNANTTMTTTANTSTGTSHSTAHTTPLTSPVTTMLGNGTNETLKETNNNTLPPFSFAKRPIDFPQKTRVSSLSGIESYFGSIQSNENQNNKNSLSKSLKNPDFDYNEQIRFPQMSHTYYTYRKSLQESNNRPILESNNKVLVEVESQNVKYKPATFDLSKPLRRFSNPGRQEAPLKRQNSDDDKLLEEYTTNNYIYERKVERDKLRDMFNNEMMSSVNHPAPKPRIRNQSSFPKLNDNNTAIPSLNQLYQLKKPLCTPAVLRPAFTNDNDSNEAVPQLKPSYSPCNSTIYTITAPISPVRFDIEPTHSHWKSNSMTNNCITCFKPLSTLLMSIICDTNNKRHHCRFCGLIYCSDCLVQDETTNHPNAILLDSNARFIIPIFENIRSKQPPEIKRLFKICRKCSVLYNVLVQDINRSLRNGNGDWKYFSDSTRDELKTLSFVYVENPYVKKESCMRFRLGSREDERNLSNGSGIGDVPNDWTWSSF